MKKLLLLLLLPILFFNCVKQKEFTDPIQFALAADSKKIQTVMQNLEAHEVQIMVTDAEGNDFSFQVEDKNYFYPASSVKFPVAILVLEKANLIPKINSETLFKIEGDSIQTTIRKEVQKIFAISDNAAYNRLFEFLGQDEIDRKLGIRSLNTARISHRVGTKNADNIQSKAITFFENDSVTYLLKTKINQPIKNLNLHRILKGKGCYRNDSLISEPMDFSKKNYLPIATLHKLMKRIQFPKNYDPKKQFKFSENDRSFLLDAMHKTPKEQGFDVTEYYDSYVKFFMFGDSENPMPQHIKIYNKVGYAYGYLTDCAHIVDEKNNVSFSITATIYVNKNQIFNDDTYEYETIGIPFLAELGRQIHQFYIKKQQN